VAMHIHSVLCERATVDNDNLVTIVRCIEAVNVAMPPGMTEAQFQKSIGMSSAPMTLVSLWRRSDPNLAETVNLEMRIVDPAGSELGKSQLYIDLSPGVNVRNISVMKNFLIRGKGGHFIELWKAGPHAQQECVVRLPIEVILKAA
jgi:hypothetical protein